MAQIQVNLEGVSVAVENRSVPLHVLKLDAQNPHIGLYKDSQPKATFSDDEIRHAIVNRGPDAYAKLRDSIEITAIPQDLKEWAGTFCVLLPHGRDE